MTISLFSPKILRVGGGAAGEIAVVLGLLGLHRPLVVSDPFMVSSGLIRRCLDPLAAAGIAAEVFAETVPEPVDTVIEAGVGVLSRGGFDCLIGFGGGSPIDTAKAMAILAAGGGRLRDYKVPAQADLPALPLIAIPTTAGTGTEVTRFTVVTDTTHHEKMLIAGLAALPVAALVDYELSLSVPARTTADTGIDSLTHALEAFVSRRANPYSDAQALAAMRLIGPNLRRVYHQPRDAAAREAMMLGATLAGLAFSNSSVALVHGMSRPIGAHFHVPHGLSNAMLLPAVTRYSLPGAAARYAIAAREIGFADAGDDEGAAGEKLTQGLQALNLALDVPSPAAFGIAGAAWEGLLDTMAQQALASGSPGNNPRVPAHGEIVALYREVWATGRNAD
jgi:alcohol dehydrogenase class IV